ncbi:MAG: hypothetical protein GY778_29210 [bacterium]|nr:hypothetical protein [bacterium]
MAIKAVREARGWPEEIKTLLKIDVNLPQLATRNRKEEVDADAVLVNSDAMSRRTMSIRANLDPDSEAEQIAEEKEARMAAMDPLMGAFGQSQPEGNDDDDERANAEAGG